MGNLAFQAAPGPAHWQLITEAERLIRDYRRVDAKTGEVVSLCPEHFRKNIRKFLLNCMAEVRYIANWHWAIHCLREGWCKWAPFRYFKMVLFNPRKYQVTEIKTYLTELKRVQTYRWLMRTKGRAAAYTWANKHDFAFNGYTVEQRKAWRAGLRKANEELGALRTYIAGRPQPIPLEVYEMRRAELKESEERKEWVRTISAAALESMWGSDDC